MADAPQIPLLQIEDLHVAVDGTEILTGVDLTVGPGEVHALMGPNGAGKSTLAATLMGHPAYQVTGGAIRFLGEDVTHWATDARAKAGLFLAFQYPESIDGVSVIQFLRQAMSARRGEDLSVLEVRFAMTEWMERLGMDPAFGERHLNQGFSGGEKKRNEILQMALLEPRMAVLDETDSGLDIDALRVVGRGVHTVRETHPDWGSWWSPTTSGSSKTWSPTTSTCWWTDGWPRAAAPSWPAGSRAGATTNGGPEMVRAASGQPTTADGGRPVDDGARGPGAGTLDVEVVRKDFPLLSRTVHDRPIVYLDSAATALQPRRSSAAMEHYYETTHANVHRGVYATAEEATRRYEGARPGDRPVHRRPRPRP